MKNKDLYHTTETYSLGGGEWSIEVLDWSGSCIKEFVGLNGTREGEEPTDLWAEYRKWLEEPAQLTPIEFSLEKLYSLGNYIYVGYSRWNSHLEDVVIEGADTLREIKEIYSRYSWGDDFNNLYGYFLSASEWEKYFRKHKFVEEVSQEGKLLLSRI